MGNGAKATLDMQGFCDLLGLTDSSQLPQQACSLIEQSDFSYRILEGEERDGIMLEALHRIHSSKLKPSGKDRQADWETGWGENLEDFKKSRYDIEALVPKYFKPDPVLRILNQYARPRDSRFELNFIKVMRAVIAERYLRKVPHVFEFGCGTGYHLAALCRQLPESAITGLDWAQATVEILKLLSQQHRLAIEGRRFDYFNPDYTLEVPQGSAFFTFASLEQIADQHGAFIQFVLDKKPEICVHVECVDDLYQEDSLLDFLALCYHRKRNYLSGFLSRLRDLERQGKASIECARRTFFGNAFHEAYSLVVWRPA